jgi:hypothetical protein
MFQEDNLKNYISWPLLNGPRSYTGYETYIMPMHTMNQERRKLQEIKEILDKMFYGSESATGMGGIWKFRYCAI